MPHKYSYEQLRLAARLYYLEGLEQSEVAHLVKVSQPKVSCLLALARERGIVRITVADYDSRQHNLETRLRNELGLTAAIVPRLVDGLDRADLRRAVGRFSAAAVDDLLPPKSIVAIAGGRTIHELVRHLPESHNKALTVVQAMGTVDSNVNAFASQARSATASKILKPKLVKT